MRLKRGVERASCDFCHGRKIKCDRASRIRDGGTQCSPCSLRRIACQLLVAGDPQLPRRELGITSSIALSVPRESETQFSTHGESSSGPKSRHVSSIPKRIRKPFMGAPPTDSHLDTMSAATPIALSEENVLFLGQVFMGSPAESIFCSLWNDDFIITESFIPDIKRETSTDIEGLSIRGTAQDRGCIEDWLQCNVDTPTVIAAIVAYFDHAAWHLPIIFSDAFWEDFNDRKCNLTLVYAIACRGAPFADIERKWEIQQRMAQSFREAFMTEQAAQGQLGLDVLSALALMLNFEYDESLSQPIHSRFGNLFLTHEALVISILHGRSSQSEDQLLLREEDYLSLYDERLALLQWHVYGLDAFHCLDKQCISRIRVDELVTPGHSGHLQDGGGYLDAVLALSTIARFINTLLCGPAAKKKGLKAADIDDLYHQMERWREKECSSWFQRPKESNLGDDEDDVEEQDDLIRRLRYAVLSFLEINCHMQIERCASQFGFQDAPSLEVDIAISRVKQNFLRAMQDASNISKWMMASDERCGAPQIQRHLADLAPSILRDICISVCSRACEHAQSIAQGNHGLQASQPYVTVARDLRNVAATATSHSDTAKSLKKVDEILAGFGYVDTAHRPVWIMMGLNQHDEDGI